MNEELLKQLVRQMKFLNFWITLFGTIGIIAMIILGVLLFQLMSFISDTNQKLGGVKQEISSSTDVKGQLCDENARSKQFLSSVGVCE